MREKNLTNKIANIKYIAHLINLTTVERFDISLSYSDLI